MDYFLLTLNGFSAFQLGISQINQQNMLVFIDNSIISLRKALLLKQSNNDGRVFYVLGKAYYYKGQGYSDLAIKYLEKARALSYNAADIYEFLGLAYAACGDYRAIVEAFSQLLASEIHASDTLLLSIARSYIALNEYVLATDYLLRCINISRDSQAIMVARLLLAEVYKISGDYNKAENLYLSILNDSGENAEVRYQLGELYNLKGDTTRARSEWRLAYRQDPVHEKALARLYR
jgi:tetratricopeptide (TPR) repeat protein